MPKDVPSQISEDDREAAVRRLQDAFAEGHISHAEMDDHLQVVLTAKTHGDLVPVIASLPDTDTGRTLTLAGKSGRFRRRGAWRVPRVLKVDSEYGKVDLDLSRAILENPVVDIELQLRFGRAKITVPGNAVVDLDDLRTVWKQPVYQVPQHLDAGGPRIRVYGTMEYGRLRIRHKGALTPSVSGFFSSLRSTDGFTSVIAGQCPTPGHQYLTSMRAAISTLDGPRHSVLDQVAVVAAYVNAGPSRDMEPSGNRRRRRFGLGAPAIAF